MGSSGYSDGKVVLRESINIKEETPHDKNNSLENSGEPNGLLQLSIDSKRNMDGDEDK